MQDVVLAMIPALLGSIYFFGINALMLVVSAVTTCVLSEYIWQRIRKEQLTTNDWSAVVTGILLAFNVPSTTPIWALCWHLPCNNCSKAVFGGIEYFANQL